MMEQPKMPVRALIPFLILSFSLTWGLAAVLIFVGFSLPVFLLAVWAPGLVGTFLVWRYYGRKGLRSFFRRLTLWRMPLKWWLYLVIGFPTLTYLGAALNGTIGEPFPFSPWYTVFAAIVQALFLLGTNEEFGWRGVALPLLQRKYSPFLAGLILGIIHAAWHIPAFFISGLQFETWSVIPYFGGVVALSVILTPIFNSSRGSLLIAYLYHFQMMNPILPDADPWDKYLVILVAVVIVILNRRTMFKKGSGVTDVLMPEEPSVSEK
ncbi:MAG: CPBP family intramembrane metalloprotease [Chloroflexi bacterium]|nr:MAG: CPBP family intramembrane metalloprotease [Chloroflexota bacterium]MBL1195470.1 CPBP family intramembrane metalloprotease [Chloroflexota bacterium]NOH12752.1 CPBP family intramembrane metalloprotease [Chloroflexota bacterium]